MVSDSAYGIRLGPKTRSRVWTRRWMAPVSLQHRAHQYAERDQQSDLGHDVAESGHDRVDRLLDAEAGGQPQVGRTDDQRDHRVELEPHDHHHDRDDRYRGVGDDGDL